MIELGGNIKLSGFEELDPPTLIVVKKIVGNYAKKIGEEATPFKELLLELKREKEEFELIAKLTSEKEIETKAKEKNLFFALDKVLNSLFSEAKK